MPVAFLLGAALAGGLCKLASRSARSVVALSFAAGAAALLLAGVLEQMKAGTPSLSMLDVRGPFAMAQSGFGLPAAVFIAALQPLLPAGALLMPVLLLAGRLPLGGGGWLARGVSFQSDKGRHRRLRWSAGRVRSSSARRSWRRVDSMGAGGSAGQAAASLALALLLRTAAEVTLLFPIVAGVLWMGLLRQRSLSKAADEYLWEQCAGRVIGRLRRVRFNHRQGCLCPGSAPPGRGRLPPPAVGVGFTGKDAYARLRATAGKIAASGGWGVNGQGMPVLSKGRLG